MRLYPPVAALMTRRLTRDVVCGGVRLPARTLVRITPAVPSRQPNDGAVMQIEQTLTCLVAEMQLADMSASARQVGH